VLPGERTQSRWRGKGGLQPPSWGKGKQTLPWGWRGWHAGQQLGVPKDAPVYVLLERVVKQLEDVSGHYMEEYFELSAKESRQHRLAQEQRRLQELQRQQQQQQQQQQHQGQQQEQLLDASAPEQQQQQQQQQHQQQQQQQQHRSPPGLIELTEHEAAVRIGQLYRALAAHFRHILLTWTAEVRALPGGDVAGGQGEAGVRQVYEAEREMQHLAVNFELLAAHFERLAQGRSGVPGSGPGHTLVPLLPRCCRLAENGSSAPSGAPRLSLCSGWGLRLGLPPGHGSAGAGAGEGAGGGYGGGLNGAQAGARGGEATWRCTGVSSRKDLDRVVDILVRGSHTLHALAAAQHARNQYHGGNV